MGVRFSHDGPYNMYNEYRNPLLDKDTQIEIAIGAIEFRDKTIKNLRQQILNLRTLILSDSAVETVEDLNSIQYSHLNL